MDLDIPTFISSLGVSSLTAIWLTKSLVAHRLEKDLQKYKNELDRSLSDFKSVQDGLIRKDVEVYLKENEADIRYNFEARARLYQAIGPLKFQLLLAARDFKARVTNIPKKPYKIDLNGHYGKSTIYRLARLLCLSELIESKVAYADFAVDESSVKLLEFKKSLFLMLSGSKITSHHPNANWKVQKEHIFFDTLSSIGNALTINEGESVARCMSFSEFTDALKEYNFVEKISPLINVMSGLCLRGTPILWVRLSCVAVLCNELIESLGRSVGFKYKSLDLSALIRESNDDFVQRKAEKYVELCNETMSEGL
ncbi:hypothetical protein ACJJIP_04745 [Microbulbifer sp. VTAC004]|uniref:hypothetical protein n=1 Tax=unclassified Microbulbifer TaxID=2619833 RepID=UPI00403979B7